MLFLAFLVVLQSSPKKPAKPEAYKPLATLPMPIPGLQKPQEKPWETELCCRDNVCQPVTPETEREDEEYER